MQKICEFCKRVFETEDENRTCCCRSCAGKLAAKKKYEGYKKGAPPIPERKDGRVKYNPRTNCFGWDNERKRCDALIKTECIYSPTCPFFKTVNQAERDRLKAKLWLKNKYS